ncbi:two-component system sensor histidine kinase UczS [Stakelama sediminis]|uniref:histidine kinase n=1 Tax=Stakelama sediminis TaxID=463200 RepID=A0A840YVS9_9SPHN|nr:HAMP domain-containing sensor histidine kinase [Stakelama sediminis]MBB5717649.1 signal transduction histidine kinase [Stakelama sediminis]
MRVTITARLALLAVTMTLATSLLLIGFIWQQSHGDAINELRRDTIEQSDTLTALWRSGGMPALRQTISNSVGAGDRAMIAEVVTAQGRRIAGQGPLAPSVPLTRDRFRIGKIAQSGQWSEREAGVAIQPVGQFWLINGHMLDDVQHAQRTIERALLLALGLALILGCLGGWVLTRYVTRRLNRIANVAEAVTQGALSHRVGAPKHSADSFDRLGRQMDGMLDRVNALVAELRLVTDSLAHDLRSPLARLRTHAVTAAKADDPLERDSALTALISEADMMTRLLSTMMEITRSEAVPADSLKPASPLSVVQELADLYAPVVEEHGLNFAFHGEVQASLKIPLHRQLLSQALANLIENAMVYGKSGDTVELTIVLNGGEVRIEVGDHGPGIAPEDHDRALSRFGRLDGARTTPGAGLGLALVAAVARMHGGRFELRDNMPGLRATLILPAVG